jgi:hypothetical protein
MSRERTGQDMTQTGQTTAEALDFGNPVSHWLRAKHISAKQAGKIVGASETTGKRLRSGITPTAEQMAKLSRHFGWAFVKHVFTDVLGPPSDAELAADLNDIKRRLAALEAE